MNQKGSNPPPTSKRPPPPPTPPAALPVSVALTVEHRFAPDSIHILDGTIADDTGRTRFTIAMRDELARRRLEGKTGWNKPDVCTIAQLEAHLEERLKAGDILGVGIAAMMIHNRVFPEAPR